MSETPENVPKRFLKEVEKLWPLSGRSLSPRKNRSVRLSCPMCRSVEGHPAYALHTGLKGKQTSLYVSDELVEKVEEAVQNGKKVRELLVEVGRCYM